jgi:uncharacterized protein YndB with AHSA1/START domain
MSTDRIDKRILLRAPRARVWRAIADSMEFGTWFGVRFDGPFVAGAPLRGVIVPTAVDPAIAELQKPYEGTPFEITVERLEPERLFSFRWHPYALEPGMDYASEPTTRVTFELHDAAEGVLLTITESGYDSIPLERRAKAFASNDEGWTLQLRLIEGYLATPR